MLVIDRIRLLNRAYRLIPCIGRLAKKIRPALFLIVNSVLFLILATSFNAPQSCAAAQSDIAPQDSPAAKGKSDQQPPPLRVGIKVAVPFAMKSEDGSWRGISIELWRAVAERLDYRYEFVELPLEELFTQLEAGEIDVAISALSITSDREKRVDFTHSYFNTGLGIAVVPKQYTGWSAVTHRIFSRVFLEVVAAILGLLVVTGTLVYFFERKANAEHFGAGIFNGVANGIWWAAVTMTTVGYGDRVPKTVGGRMMALIWMFSAILIIASFTASVTSTLTVSRLESAVSSSHDLHEVRVATVADSTSSKYLARERILFSTFATIQPCLDNLVEKKVDAVIYDAAMLQYLSLDDYAGEFTVLPSTFEKQDYAIALRELSPLREPINQALLDELADPNWLEIVQRYLGNPVD